MFYHSNVSNQSMQLVLVEDSKSISQDNIKEKYTAHAIYAKYWQLLLLRHWQLLSVCICDP